MTFLDDHHEFDGLGLDDALRIDLESRWALEPRLTIDDMENWTWDIRFTCPHGPIEKRYCGVDPSTVAYDMIAAHLELYDQRCVASERMLTTIRPAALSQDFDRE